MTEVVRAVVWVVDDLEANHHLVRRSLPPGHESACDFVCYLSAERALEELTVALDAKDADALPDVVFMDFFLGGLYGTEVTERVRQAFKACGLQGPFIVGHSSAPAASMEIVRAGGDVAIEKDRHAPISRGVCALFPDAAAFSKYAGRARRPVS